MITEHLQVQQIYEATDGLGHEVVPADEGLHRDQHDVRQELELELMLLQLKAMHHLLESMRPAKPRSRSDRRVVPPPGFEPGHTV